MFLAASPRPLIRRRGMKASSRPFSTGKSAHAQIGKDLLDTGLPPRGRRPGLVQAPSSQLAPDR
jgi:hypothetical protein